MSVSKRNSKEGDRGKFRTVLSIKNLCQSYWWVPNRQHQEPLKVKVSNGTLYIIEAKFPEI